ncbi:MAG: hypothetical protein GTN82_12815 [Candidatus Aminicenantes bacterium]|nr:hypothetical protein [Candidatus Aminicenantes bacterium]
MRTKIQQKIIKKAYQDEFRNINTSLESIKNTIGSSQKIKIDTPIEIKVVEKETEKKKNWKLILIGCLSFIILTLAPFGEIILNSPITEPIKSKSNTIKGFISYPPRVSVGHEEMIELMLTNNSNSTIEEVKSFVIYPQETAVKITSNNGSSMTNFEKMEVNETKSKALKFQLEKKPTGEDEIKITLEITSKTLPEILEKPYPISIPIHPWPWIKSIILHLLKLLGIYIIIPIVVYIREKILQSRLP